MSSLVFLEFSKGKIKDFSKQSITVANQLGSSVLGITDSKDYNYLDSLGEFGLDKVYSISNLDIVDSYIDIIKTEGKASTSFLQRKLQIGYNRAARIIDMMEANGEVSKANHVGKREVLK